MPSKGEVEAKRKAEARQLAARVGVRLAIRDAFESGLSAEDVAQEVATTLRERGLLGTADKVVKDARSVPKK